MPAVVPESQREVLEDNENAFLPEPKADADAGEEFVDLLTTPEPEKKVAKPQPEAEAPAPESEEDPEIPAELRGKSKKEIAKMYREAQSVIGRQGNELGEFRRRADQFILTNIDALRQKQAAPAPQSAPEAAEIDDTAIFAKPKETINQMIEKSPIIQEIRKTLGQAAEAQAVARATAATDRFNAAHPDASQIMADPEFRAWVAASPVRRQLVLRAHNQFDFDAGDEVFSTWKALRGITAKAAPAAPAAGSDDAAARAAAQTLAKRKQALRDAAAPTSGNAAPQESSGSKKIYRRADVLRLMENDPDRYEQLAPEIELAYAEGRVR